MSDDVVAEQQEIHDSLIDWQDLAQRIGNEDLIVKVVGLFIDTYPLQIKDLVQAVQAEQAGQVHALAHAIKGAAASIGAKPLAQAALQLEMAGRQGDKTVFADRLEQLQVAFGQLDVFLAQDNWIAIAKEAGR